MRYTLCRIESLDARLCWLVFFPQFASWHGSVAGTTYSTTWALSTIDDETGVLETISGADTFTQQ
jgi:hypothetical protein